MVIWLAWGLGVHIWPELFQSGDPKVGRVGLDFQCPHIKGML